jgi:hypothetical protein
VAADSLEQLQRRFWRLITAPSGVAQALPEESQLDPDVAPLSRWISGPDEAFAQSRLDIYANMYFYRLLDVLKGDYPKILALVGETNFHNLVTDYILQYPSENPSLRYLGERFATFVKESARAKDWPHLYDLALLEWSRSAVFDLKDQTPITKEALAQFTPEQWGSLIFTAIEASALVRLSAPVGLLWSALDTGEPIPALEAKPCAVLVWRRGYHVHHRPLSDNEASAVALLQEAAPFYLLCECFEAADEEISETAAKAFQAIQRWLDDGLLSSVELGADE